MDNGSSHTSKAARAWIAAHPRFAVTYTPKHASWLNMIEQWFSVLTRRLLRRGRLRLPATTSRTRSPSSPSATTKPRTPTSGSYDADADHARYLERHPQRTDLDQAA